jgi:hypothetical protein
MAAASQIIQIDSRHRRLLHRNRIGSRQSRKSDGHLFNEGVDLPSIDTVMMLRPTESKILFLQQLGHGLRKAKGKERLSERSWRVMQRRRPLLADLPEDMRGLLDGASATWQSYWRSNPVAAWVGANRTPAVSAYFTVADARFAATFGVALQQLEAFSALVQELVDYRLAAYVVRRAPEETKDNVIPFRRPVATSMSTRTELPYFPNLKIACGHFRAGSADAEEYRALAAGHGRLERARHFIARASGNSINGGKQPIRDGDYLLLEHVSPGSAGSITGHVVAIERRDDGGDNQYLLRLVTKTPNGRYILKANNPDYPDLPASDEMRTLARLKAVIEPLEMAVGQAWLREEIPSLFGEIFNPGNWNTGHVVLKAQNAHILLVTLDLYLLFYVKRCIICNV